MLFSLGFVLRCKSKSGAIASSYGLACISFAFAECGL